MEEMIGWIKNLRGNPSDNINKEEIKTYLDYYQINYEKIVHETEFYNYNGEEIYIQTFKPPNPIGIVIVVHGYFDHTGSLSNLINYLTRKQYQVIAYDLQGHGLSTGVRASILEFDEYVRTFKGVYERTLEKTKTSLRVFVIAHSTGGAILLEYIFQYGNPFKKVIIISPLIRSSAWSISKIGYTLINPFIDELHRVFKSNSTNQQYLEFVKKDPLQYKKVPLSWFKSLMAWNQKISKYSKLEEELFVIQGDQDRTVDWRYNLNFIQEKFPNSRVRMVNGGNHQLFNEDQSLLQKTLEYIGEILKRGKM